MLAWFFFFRWSMSQAGIGSCAGNSSSVKGAREKSVLGQDSGRRGKTSTVATDFLPLITWFIAELQRSEFSSFQHSYHIWFRQRNARSHPNRYLDQKVTDTEKQMHQINTFASKIIFPGILPKKGKFFSEGNFSRGDWHQAMGCFDL